MTRKDAPPLTHDDVVLWVLGYEFPTCDRQESERKIRQRLRYRKLGAYNQQRVDRLRLFKDAIQQEVHRGEKSRYYTGSHGKFTDMQDFDRESMRRDYGKQFPKIPRRAIRWFVEFAVFTYHVR